MCARNAQILHCTCEHTQIFKIFQDQQPSNPPHAEEVTDSSTLQYFVVLRLLYDFLLLLEMACTSLQPLF